VCGRYLGKGQQVAIEGRLQTRTWDDERGARHWKTEIVATNVEMLSGRRKKDYAAEAGSDEADAAAAGPEEVDETAAAEAPASEPIAA
jgi:single-strand DNA-binding protein